MKQVLKVNGEVTDIVLAERDDKNHAQLEKDARLPFMKCINSIPTGHMQMMDESALECLWSDGNYYSTEVIE